MKAVAFALCLGMLSVSASTQSSADKEVLAAEQALLAAIQKGDAAAYDGVTSDDFAWVTPAGTVITKAERMELIKRGALPDFRSSDQKVRMYGDVAVVMGLHGQGTAKPMRYSRVWVKQNDQWRAVLNHATSVTAQ